MFEFYEGYISENPQNKLFSSIPFYLGFFGINRIVENSKINKLYVHCICCKKGFIEIDR